MKLSKLAQAMGSTIGIFDNGMDVQTYTYGIAVTPERFGAKGDGKVDDTVAMQKAFDYIRDNPTGRLIAANRYAISDTLYIDNFSQGCRIEIAQLTLHPSWVNTGDKWLNAKAAIEVGAKSNGSMVGLYVGVQYFHGSDKATLYRLTGFGAGGSRFHGGRVRNVIGVYQCDSASSANSASNYISGEYWYQGTFGIRVRRNGAFISEGLNIQVGFLTNFKYGGIQLFNGAQYWKITNTDVDFCGQWLAELQVDRLPASDIRTKNIQYNDNEYEVLDYYEQPRGTYKLLVIDKQLTTDNKSSFSTSVSTAISDGTTAYTLQAVVTPKTNNAYFDFIHGFQGAPFSRGKGDFGYLSRAVGGNWNGSTIFFNNSFQEVTNSINNVWIRNQGNRVSIVDRWTGTSILAVNTQGDMACTLPGGFITKGVSTLGGAMFTGSHRVYGSEVATTLVKSTAKTIRTFSKQNDGTETRVAEMYDVHVTGPDGLEGVGGFCQVIVHSSKIEVRSASGVAGMTLSTSGMSLQATQTTQDNMLVLFMIERK